MENRGWLRPRAESSSRSGTPAPARGALAAAAAAGRQEREDESLLPATRSIVSSPSSSSSFASSGGGARLQSNLGLGFAPGRTTHGGRGRERETGGNERRRRNIGAVGYAGPISAAQLPMWAFGYTLLGLKPLASLLSNEIAAPIIKEAL